MRPQLVFASLFAVGCGTPAATSHDAAPPPEDTAAPVEDTAAPAADAPPPSHVTTGTGTTFGAGIGPVTTCDVTKPFSAVVPIQGLSMVDDSFTFSSDYLTIYLSSARGTGNDGFDLWTATRPSFAGVFGELTRLDASSGGDDQFPVLSHDGLRLYHTWQASEVRMATRASITGSFDTFATVEGLIEAHAGRIWLSGDEKQVYFDSFNTADGNQDLFVADFAKDTATNLKNLGAINSPSDDSGPVLTADGLTLYFSSNRPDGTTTGGFRVYVARRLTTTDPFGAPALVTEFKPAIHDNIFWVSPEGCTVYIRRLGAGANISLIQATRGQ